MTFGKNTKSSDHHTGERSGSEAPQTDSVDPLWQDAIATARSSYHKLRAISPPEDLKGATLHHMACRAALTHLQSLLQTRELVRNVGSSDTIGDEAEDLLSLILEARKSLESFEDV